MGLSTQTQVALVGLLGNGPTVEIAAACFSVDSSGVYTVNAARSAGDYRISSSGNANAIYVDATNSRVGINNGTPTKTLDITGTLLVSSTATFDGLVVVNDSLTIAGAGNFLQLPASTAAAAPLYIEPGAAPSEPVEGDIWYDSTAHALKYQDNVGTKTITAS